MNKMIKIEVVSKNNEEVNSEYNLDKDDLV